MAIQPLLFGIDKLEGSFEIPGYGEQAGELTRTLLTLKEVAQMERKPVPYDIGTRTFLVEPKGRQFYEITLRHADFILWLTDFQRDGTPPVLAAISSEYLWAVGPIRAVKEVYRTLAQLGLTVTADKCSRVDLMLDYCGRPLAFKDLYDIVCSSRKRMPLDGNFLAPDEYLGHVGQRQRREGLSTDDGLDIRQYAIQKGNRVELTGLVVALGQPLSWRGYNKVLEIERVSGKRWFFDIWKDNGWEPDDEGEYPVVFRSEFQVRREAITDMAPILEEKLDTMMDVINQVPAIWRYLTGEWMQFKNKRADTNVTRAPVRKWWRELQQPQINGGMPLQLDWETINPVERLGRLRKAKRKVLDDMIAGCLAGVAAHQGTAGDMTGTVDTWIQTLDKTLAPGGDVAQLAADWGLKARQKAMNYLLADLKTRLKCVLRDPDAELADLTTVIHDWREQLPQDAIGKFAERSKQAAGTINHGKGDTNDAEGGRDRAADEGPGA